MSPKILQVIMNYSIPRAALEKAFLDGAQPIANTPGLLWKVWLLNEAGNEAGGIYLFESEEASQAYVAGPIVASIKSNPILSNLKVKSFDVLERHSAITRAPLKQIVTNSG